MRFKGLDLNLLVALDALLAEASVSRAAERLYLSQPAASAALARLRTWFGDPLLIPHGKRLMLTPYALRLKPMLSELLASVETLVTQPVLFDPATTHRRFRICTSDYITCVVLRPLLSEIAVSAPGIELDIVPPEDTGQDMLERGELDMLIIPREFVSPQHPARLLLEEQHVVAGWRDNPVMNAPMTAEAFVAAGHISVRLGRITRLTYAEAQLRARGITRREEVVVPSFTLVPDLLVGTGRLAIMHERLARQAARQTDIRIASLPFDFPPMHEMIQYHRARADDAGLLWFLDAITAVVPPVST
ncbi:LysR family transcriptional regulator [Novosphingobium cyanobacteriorum]|uniref:LysR family transcriptional regulator n=1 Tax=Novosphingobium cyanobacteriorum TaxID=3024215 RepID=A0ABT6CIR2_9SPHN|nr:LysR family transcriptional regulator [Novosphingobium cyanobacteriorum]MDF8333791.1 LysR family transcriptional regulator [Novosphingobium cyanobacteriorum]